MKFLDDRIDRVNGIIDFIEDPCHAPWTVYFETALPPLGNFVLALLTFGLDDVVRGYFRPRGLYSPRRTGRRGRRTRLSKWRRYALPELGEEVGHVLPGAEKVSKRGVSQGVKNLWIIDGVLQRLLFWWMILDELSEALHYWASLLRKTEYCQLDRLIGNITCGVQQTGSIREILNPLACSVLEKQWGDVGQHGGAFQYYSPVGITAASVVAIPWVDEPHREFTGFDVWIAEPSDPYVPLSEPAKAQQDHEGNWTAVVKAAHNGPKITRAYYLGHGRNSFITGGHLMGWAYKW